MISYPKYLKKAKVGRLKQRTVCQLLFCLSIPEGKAGEKIQ
jgi:hypothetical protein